MNVSTALMNATPSIMSVRIPLVLYECHPVLTGPMPPPLVMGVGICGNPNVCMNSDDNLGDTNDGRGGVCIDDDDSYPCARDVPNLTYSLEDINYFVLFMTLLGRIMSHK